jgi:flagellar biogenesis protein FliO
MKQVGKQETALATLPLKRLGGWLLKPLLNRLHRPRFREPRLALLERIALAPRQSLALVEAEGRRFLVATSAEGGPAFYALDGGARPAVRRAPRISAPRISAPRVSW